MITFEQVKNDASVATYIKKADESLAALGYTEHSFFHVTRVAETAAMVLEMLGYGERDIELARISGYLHDIGNVINRVDHAQSGAVMAFRILDRLGADAEDIATIITAIGNHDEGTAFPVNPVAAALMIADKTDVRYTRVRNTDVSTFDIHDRVNYSVREAEFSIKEEGRKYAELSLQIDTSICAVMDYFEIFLGRMLLCRKASDRLGIVFRLVINGQQLL